MYNCLFGAHIAGRFHHPLTMSLLTASWTFLYLSFSLTPFYSNTHHYFTWTSRPENTWENRRDVKTCNEEVSWFAVRFTAKSGGNRKKWVNSSFSVKIAKLDWQHLGQYFQLQRILVKKLSTTHSNPGPTGRQW